MSSRRAEASRLARSPTSYRRVDPPPGTLVSSFPDHTWPDSWLVSVAIPESVRQLRGATHTVEEAIAASATGRVDATIIGRDLGGGSAVEDWRAFQFGDGTGKLAVVSTSQTAGVRARSALELEIDVVIEPGEEDGPGNLFMPPGVAAFALAIREIPGT